MALLFRGRAYQATTVNQPTVIIMQNVKLVKGANHSPRTSYNQAMWAAVTSCKGIATGVAVSALHAHCMAQVPTQSVGHCTAHIKYLVRQKGALAYTTAA